MVVPLVASLLLSPALLAPGSDPRSPDHPIQPLKVLFAGEKGTPREAAFVSFLGQQFAKVESIDASELTTARARDCDVVVADGRVDLKDNHIVSFGCAKIDFAPDWTKPTILVGPTGGRVEKISKIGWL